MFFREHRTRGRGPWPLAAKEIERRRRRRGLWHVVPLLMAAVWGCGGQERAREKATPRDTAETSEAREIGRYRFAEGSILLEESGSTRVLAVLPGFGAGPDTLSDCGPPVMGLRAAHLQLVMASPDTGRVAWTSTAPGACLGVVEGAEARVRVLGRLSEAVPDSLAWSPDGEHLAVWLRHPGGGRSLSVYDVKGGKRLAMPWEEECSRRDGCEVVSAEWLGNSLFDVKIRMGPAEEPIAYEVNVIGLAPLEEEVE